MPQTIAILFFAAFCIIVFLLVKGVQNAKRNGTYLLPDDPSQYGAEVDETTFHPTQEQKDEILGAKLTNYIYSNEDENFDEQGDYINF